MNIIVAQIAGFLGLIFLLIAMQRNDKGEILKNQMLANVFYELQYISLGAVSGACMCAVALLRNIIFNDYANKHKPVKKRILAFLILLMFLLGIYSYDGFYSLIPIVMTMLYSYAIWQDNLKKLRLICIITIGGSIYYNLVVGAYVAFVAAIIELFFVILAIERFDISHKIKKIKQKESKNE